jgi:hypothetical protein
LKKILFTLSVFLLLLQSESFAQSISLRYNSDPLSEILLDLNNEYGVQISISSKNAARCKLTINQTFGSIDKAIKALAAKCNLEVSKIGGVYTFRKPKRGTTPKPPKVKPTPRKARVKQLLYQGEVVDQRTLEPLPYTPIKTSNTVIYTDDNGRFSFKSTLLKEGLHIRYLGYHSVDTLISKGTKHVIKLDPQVQEIDEIEIVAIKPLELNAASTGELVGNIKLNDINTTLIPGSNSNLLFNRLRLYPGIMAAGEVTSDFIIWGSYSGQNHIIYDEITLFNSSGMNNDLGRVNPYMIKNMEVYKGGYNVHIGDRTGAILLIDSKSGAKKFGGEFNVDNRITSGYFNIPLFNKRSTLQVAARKSYYQFLDPKSFSGPQLSRLQPNYEYGDANLKFSTLFKNKDRLQLSAIASLDNYKGQLDKGKITDYFSTTESASTQIGASLKYTKNWKSGGLSDLVVAQSSFNPRHTSFSILKYSDTLDQPTQEHNSSRVVNRIHEISAKLIHVFPAKNKQQLRLSFGHTYNSYSYNQRDNEVEINSTSGDVNRLSFHLMDNIALRNVNLQAGIKADAPLGSKNVFIQPRITAKVSPNDHWNVNLGWGLYDQFVSNVPVIDSIGNQSQVWLVNDGREIPVQHAMHNVLGLHYRKQNIEFGVEGYYKSFKGLSKFEILADTVSLYSKGIGRAYGADFFMKWRIRKHQWMFSYSTGRVEELFDDTDGAQYQLAQHSQPHELKTGFSFDLNPFQLSLTGVYGSGFLQQVDDANLEQRVPYSRIDLAFKYTKKWKRATFSTGLSILNVLNTKNERLYEVTNFSDGSSFSTSGTPFTPTVFLNIKF